MPTPTTLDDTQAMGQMAARFSRGPTTDDVEEPVPSYHPERDLGTYNRQREGHNQYYPYNVTHQYVVVVPSKRNVCLNLVRCLRGLATSSPEHITVADIILPEKKQKVVDLTEGTNNYIDACRVLQMYQKQATRLDDEERAEFANLINEGQFTQTKSSMGMP